MRTTILLAVLLVSFGGCGSSNYTDHESASQFDLMAFAIQTQVTGGGHQEEARECSMKEAPVEEALACLPRTSWPMVPSLGYSRANDQLVAGVATWTPGVLRDGDWNLADAASIRARYRGNDWLEYASRGMGAFAMCLLFGSVIFRKRD